MSRDVLEAEFAGFVATLGRGPGRSRALNRDEARHAFAMVLRGEPDPMQVGAFLMLLRYRGEDPEEITGLVEAARAAGIQPGGADPGSARSGRPGSGQPALGRQGVAADFPAVDLDWPSYGAGRTRGAPWFLLAALALADCGMRILMHGSNEFSGGIPVAAALSSLGRPVCRDAAAVAEALHVSGFAYWPTEAMAPRLAVLLGLRRLFGLRSPVNTVARLLDPADAAASVDGVFHPPYIALHLAVAARLQRPSLLVLKGGGGEAERAPGKPVVVHLQRAGQAALEVLLPALGEAAPRDLPQPDPAAIWNGEASDPAVIATIAGTIAIALLATGQCKTAEDADREAGRIWRARRNERRGSNVGAS